MSLVTSEMDKSGGEGQAKAPGLGLLRASGTGSGVTITNIHRNSLTWSQMPTSCISYAQTHTPEASSTCTPHPDLLVHGSDDQALKMDQPTPMLPAPVGSHAHMHT